METELALFVFSQFVPHIVQGQIEFSPRETCASRISHFPMKKRQRNTEQRKQRPLFALTFIVYSSVSVAVLSFGRSFSRR